MIKVIATIDTHDGGTQIDLDYEVDAEYTHVRQYFEENSAALRLIRAMKDEMQTMIRETAQGHELQKMDFNTDLSRLFGVE
jgi:hypothetical protein